MQYLGSKRRIAKEILLIILHNRKENQWFVEPFCGGCNLTEHVKNNVLASDGNKYVIELFKALQNGFIPPSDVSEELYKDVKKNKENYPIELVSFINFCCSFGGRFFEGYARDSIGNRNFALESKNNLLKQIEKLRHINFVHFDYKDLQIPNNSIIYCDPPYQSTKEYLVGVNHDEFWQKCREWILKGHSVFVSEITAPQDFVCVWEQKLNCTISAESKESKNFRIERLFVHESQLEKTRINNFFNF